MSNKATYSLMCISPDSKLGDRVAIGMLIFKDEKLTLKFSDDKLKSLKTILGEKFAIIKKSIIATQRYIDNIDMNKNPIINEASNIVSEAYLHKLSVYSNGIIQFQEPKLAILTDKFDLVDLYDSLFPETQIEKSEKIKNNHRSIIDNELINRLKSEVHVRFDINHKVIPNFYLDYNLDVIGKNGLLYLVKYLDFTSIQNADLSHLLVTNDNLNRQFNKGNINQCFILGAEPDLASEEHKKWDYLYKCEGFILKHPNEADLVANRIIEAKAKKFIEI